MMQISEHFKRHFRIRQSGTQYRTIWQVLHLDPILLIGIVLLSIAGFIILFSAGNEHITLVIRQSGHIFLALVLMFVLAQIPPWFYQRWSLWFYLFSLVSLMAVLVVGHTALGGQRWIKLGFFRFQPSDLMRIAIPMMLAWYFCYRALPPTLKDLLIAALIIFIPAAITAKEPDLGSAIILVMAGLSVLLFAGMRWRVIFFIAAVTLLCAPVAWHFLHGYQKQRILIFLNPEHDPLGAGYHIIQSKIAIGSGGLFGKGWMQGTQSQLDFLPENKTDFIFSVCAEEFGFVGCMVLLLLYLFVLIRCFIIAASAQDTYTRLLAGSLSFLFFASMFVNMGMVTGILPVVGLPLPLVSYGGTSMLTLLSGFGVIMSIHTHKKLL